jgi:hypothetical protein
LHNILIDLRMIFIEKVSVGGIEEPILSLIWNFDSMQTHPMVSNSEHKAYNQRLISLVVFKVSYPLVQLPPLLFR